MSDAAPSGRQGLESLRLDKRGFDRSRRRRWRGPLVLIVVAAVVLLAFAVMRRAPTVETITAPPPSRAPSEVAITATGYVVARRKAAVGAKIPGRLSYLGVEEGSRVRRGDVIARLESDDLLASARSAEARVAAAKADLAESRARLAELEREERRQRDLHEAGIAPRSAWESAESLAGAGRARESALSDRLRSEEFLLANARATLENTVVRAPFDGVVLTKDAEVGESVAPAVGGGGTTRGSMVTMADMDSLEVEADVGEASLSRLVPAMPAEIVLDAFPDRPYPAVLHQIVPTADRQRATVQVKVRFTGDRSGVLPEMSAKVNFLDPAARAGVPRRPVVVVPRSALLRTERGWSVLCVTEGVLRQVPVTLAGEPSRDAAEVVDGLAGGEDVVVAVKPGLGAGSRVRVVPWRGR